MITIYINNIKYNFPEKCTVEQAVGKKRIGSVIKIWLNDETAEKDSCSRIYLKEGDRIKVKRIQHMT